MWSRYAALIGRKCGGARINRRAAGKQRPSKGWSKGSQGWDDEVAVVLQWAEFGIDWECGCAELIVGA